jgi:hypothetical protein
VNWKAQAVSFAGVLLLAVVTRLMGVGRSEPLTRDEVEAFAATELLPSPISQSFLDTDGRAAIVRATDGRMCLVKQHGAHLASRLLGPHPIWLADGDALVIDPGDRMFGAVRLTLPPAERDRLRALL